jgi:hypothetical protein
MRMNRTFIFGLGSVVLSIAGVSSARADDLALIAGNWATSAQACNKWKFSSFKTTSEASGNIMSIVGNTVAWSRGGCTLSNVQAAGGAINAQSECERRGNTAKGSLKIKVESASKIVVDAGSFGYSGTYVKCDCKPKSSDDFLGCQ